MSFFLLVYTSWCPADLWGCHVFFFHLGYKFRVRQDKCTNLKFEISRQLERSRECMEQVKRAGGTNGA
jgi:hypothetical protein